MPPMKLLREPLPGLFEFEFAIHIDDRGSFQEIFNRETLAGFGIDLDIMQDNESWTASCGTIRGLHLQIGEAAQGKLIRVTRGRVLDVALELLTPFLAPGDFTWFSPWPLLQALALVVAALVTR